MTSSGFKTVYYFVKLPDLVIDETDGGVVIRPIMRGTWVHWLRATEFCPKALTERGEYNDLSNVRLGGEP